MSVHPMAEPQPGGAPLWRPSAERVRASHLEAWRQQLQARHGFAGDDYFSLHRWSVEHLEAFWAEAWHDAAIQAGGPQAGGQAVPPAVEVARNPRLVLTDPRLPPDRTPPHEVWFPGVRFNFAQHLLRFRDDRPALIAEGEASPRRTLTYRELYRQVACCAEGLQSLGVRTGDRVAALMPNTLETVVAMLATTSLGALWSSTSPDFGFQGVLDRFGQIDPKILLCADGYQYNGKAHEVLDKAAALMERLPSIRHVVVLPFLGRGGRKLPEALGWSELITMGAQRFTGREPRGEFPLLPFDHPVYILYSSGTTGVPKCIVHGAGGTLLKHHVEQKFHTDL
ncbi:MAG TPA: AMP-binding protein, partial [bacterium]|nr:AMP-binding protein [bacterium]